MSNGKLRPWSKQFVRGASGLGCLLCLLPRSLRADVHLPAMFSDHMVLTRAEKVPVWGKAGPGEHVHVTLDGKSVEAIADAGGKFRADLNLKDSGNGPFEMTVEGTSRVDIHDVVVGEVWLASGQSNMQLSLKETQDASHEIANSTNPLLRQFFVKRGGSNRPTDDCVGKWSIAGPETAGDFTAVGYYFGKELQQSHQIPVGIIHASNGGTYIEPWTPSDAFDRVPQFKASADALRKQAAEYPIQKAKFAADYADWLKRNAREDIPCKQVSLYADPNVSTADWQVVSLPGKVIGGGFPPSGTFWFRRDINVSALLAGQGFKVMIGPLEGDWQVYWNGDKIDEMTYARLAGNGAACYFTVPREHILTGKNTLAIRIFSPASPLNIVAGSLWAGPLDLNGQWLARVERSFPELSPEARSSLPKRTFSPPDGLPGTLFNGMINPLVPFALSGVLWYQGENNVRRAYEYRIAFPTLINGWREKWGRDDLPFYFCQLCNNFAKAVVPGESEWAELRESQSLALQLPATGQAVTIDLGEAGDLHYRDKKTVGHRLFLIAEAEHFGRPVTFSGPTYQSVAFESNRARIRFDHADGGLAAAKLPDIYNVKSLTGETAPLVRNSPDSELEGFAICGADRKWVWANAKIDQDSVVVWSDRIPEPVAVRYAWADNPTCNLCNGAGLPASPFRTDHFPLTTEGKHF